MQSVPVGNYSPTVPTAPVGIYAPSDQNWQEVFDFVRRQNASSVQMSQKDIIHVCQLVSSRIWTSHPWQFTLTTSPEIVCRNGEQTYPAPRDCYRLVKAWLRFPRPIAGTSSTVPPPDDPSALALLTAAASAAFVQSEAVTVDAPAYDFYPLTVVKTLDNDLYPTSVVRERTIAQMGNSGEWRLGSATYIPAGQPCSIFGQYQPFSPKVYDLGKRLWLPQDYVHVAEAGIEYYLLKANNDPRAGTASFANGQQAYSGQLASWMAEIESAAAQEREGSVDTFVPDTPLGAQWVGSGIWTP